MPTTSLTPRQRVRALGLAFVGNIAPILVVVLHDLEEHRTVFFVGAAIAAVAPVGTMLLSADSRVVRWAFQYGGLVGLTMMQAHSGGAGSPYAILLVAPAIWFGSSVTGGELRVGLALMVACCFVPLLIGPPAYPRELEPALVLAFVLSMVIGSLAYYHGEVLRLTEELRHDATHDRLTGLLNRRGWEESTEEAVARAAPGTPVTVALLDLDRLKEINDTMGHDEGDRVLTETADRMRDTMAPGSLLARLGGDEFVVLLVGASPAQAREQLDRLRLVTPDRSAFSAGIAALTGTERLGDAMRRADLALYEVKSSGRGRAQVAEQPVG